jgi:phosphoadenosine phosphosulfate reductase
VDDLLPDTSALEGLPTEEVVRWALERFGDRIAVSTALGPSGVVLLHLAQQVRPGVRAFFLDTGYHFPETLEHLARLEARLGLTLERVHPDSAEVAARDAASTPLYQTSPEACCALRKVEPMDRVLRGLDAWMTGIRRDQGGDRAHAPVAEWKTVGDRAVLKLNPLVAWDRKRIWAHLFAHDLPYNPLHDQGYPSVGCWPCTRPADADAGERSGRFVGQSRTECGLHTRF